MIFYFVYYYVSSYTIYSFMFFLKYTATTEIYTYCHTLSLHDALPIFSMGMDLLQLFGAGVFEFPLLTKLFAPILKPIVRVIIGVFIVPLFRLEIGRAHV